MPYNSIMRRFVIIILHDAQKVKQLVFLHIRKRGENCNLYKSCYSYYLPLDFHPDMCYNIYNRGEQLCR